METQSIYLDQGAPVYTWLRHVFVPAPGFSWDMWIGNWVAAVLTLALFSYLVCDNRIFKFAEHIFIGSATGYLIVRYNEDAIVKQLWTPFFNPPQGAARDWWLIIPMVLGLMTFMKLIPSVSWGVRWPLAFFAGVGIGTGMVGYFQANIVEQTYVTILDVRYIDEFHQDFTLKLRSDDERKLLAQAADEYKAKRPADRSKFLKLATAMIRPVLERREWIPAETLLLHVVEHGLPEDDTILLKHRDWSRLFNSLFMWIGVFTGLVYFFFSVEHRGLMGGVSRVGIGILMITFGASFGYTVMARISLLIGRLQFLFGDWLHLKSGLSSISM